MLRRTTLNIIELSKMTFSRTKLKIMTLSLIVKKRAGKGTNLGEGKGEVREKGKESSLC